MSGRCLADGTPSAASMTLHCFGGIPFTRHFDTAWGDTEHNVASAVCDPARSTTSSNTSMRHSVNPQLTNVNRHLIAGYLNAGIIQPMVELTVDQEIRPTALAQRIRQFIMRRGVNYARYGAMLTPPVTAQAVSKWLKGGKASDENLKAIAELEGIKDWLDLKREPGKRKQQEKSVVPIDPVDVEMVGQFLDALPSEQREVWLAIGSLLVQRFAPHGTANPFVRPLPKPRSTRRRKSK